MGAVRPVRQPWGSTEGRGRDSTGIWGVRGREEGLVEGDRKEAEIQGWGRGRRGRMVGREILGES